jgi:hypothetical protein
VAFRIGGRSISWSRLHFSFHFLLPIGNWGFWEDGLEGLQQNWGFEKDMIELLIPFIFCTLRHSYGVPGFYIYGIIGVLGIQQKIPLALTRLSCNGIE